MNHSTWVNTTRVYGAIRYEGRCEGCPWKGDRRCDRAEAVADGELHETLVDIAQRQREEARAA